MKLLLLFLIIFSVESFAVCPAITRTNNAANTVLTSAKYNSDLNTVYSFVNSYNAECIADGTLPATALSSSLPISYINTSTSGPVFNSEKYGCEITLISSDTINVSACSLMVGGIVSSSSAVTSWTWGNPGDAAFATETQYYIYAKKQATLGLEVLTATPDVYGYRSTSRILGKFYVTDNGFPAGYIAQNSIGEWDGHSYNGNVRNCSGFIDTSSPYISMTRGTNNGCFTSVANASTGVYSATLDNNIFSTTGTKPYPVCTMTPASSNSTIGSDIGLFGSDNYGANITVSSASTEAPVSASFYYSCTGLR